MPRFYYSDTLTNFFSTDPALILGKLAKANEFALEQTQRGAWEQEISILKQALLGYTGQIYFEYSIPRMGKRIDVVLLISSVIFILEFKVGQVRFEANALDQVWDYALDLKNFHETSHDPAIAPILVATEASSEFILVTESNHNDKVLLPMRVAPEQLRKAIATTLQYYDGEPINPQVWGQGGYQPTPTIIEAAIALYSGHSVQDISRNDAGAINLKETSAVIQEIIQKSKAQNQKSICFVTGVPGAGKTLVGLNIATQNIDKDNDLYSVFLSGNGPLVLILREALARDKWRAEQAKGKKLSKGEARRDVKLFIQNVHNFRDDCLVDLAKPPLEHVALFDEAQRAWNLQQTVNFMRRKKNIAGFRQSEPGFLISCMDRHPDWAVVVCLVGSGQEINTGEAGIAEWFRALQSDFPDWHIYVSPQITSAEFGSGDLLGNLANHPNLHFQDDLHLAVSIRSFRSENVSLLVKQILDLDAPAARQTLLRIGDKYPIVLTRDVSKAKQWLQQQARGNERYGLLVSSQAIRLKPLAVDVRATIDPIHWFLDGKEDIRSSYYLEDVATEFQVQGLELDWACIIWDGDFRRTKNGWMYKSFVGSKWNSIKKDERQVYLKNAYRVLLTRARQGMVIVVPDGDPADPTRKPEVYDPTYAYLKSLGLPEI
ncbi:MAG TPA: DUF2075 domain-containing protein [Anaerolineaceae bacterium]|nr:DUF2075 domain-containing protein [Anaerolineaceae bacterium]